MYKRHRVSFPLEEQCLAFHVWIVGVERTASRFYWIISFIDEPSLSKERSEEVDNTQTSPWVCVCVCV